MKALLVQEVPVERFAVFAELAWLERRPELGALCRAGRTHGSRIARDVVHAALPGLSEVGAHNVIRWCQALALCDSGGSLTALGEEVAETDEAPVPEQGVYGFWLARHPVLGSRLLAVVRLASRRDPRFDAIAPLEHEPDRGVVFRSVVEPSERFVLRDLPSNHRQVGVLPQTTSSACRLRWTLDFAAGRDEWQLEGRIETSPMQHEAEHDGLDLRALADLWGAGPLAKHGRWDPGGRRLAVAFSGLSPEEQDRFVKTVQLPSVKIPGKGSYDSVTLEDVPIGPAAAKDTQAWAMARLLRRLEHQPKYRSRRDVRQLFVELIEDTPLEQYVSVLPPHATWIGEQLRTSRPEVFWSVAAPVDLAPQVPGPEELGELRIGGSR